MQNVAAGASLFGLFRNLPEFLIAGLKFTAGAVKCVPSSFYFCSLLKKEELWFYYFKGGQL